SLNAGPDSTRQPRSANREATAPPGKAKENQWRQDAVEIKPIHFRFRVAGETKETQKSLRRRPARGRTGAPTAPTCRQRETCGTIHASVVTDARRALRQAPA